MRSTFVIGDSLLVPTEDVAIGDLVVDPQHPHHGFYSCTKILEANVSVSLKTNFKEKEKDSRSYGLRGALSQIAKASFKSMQKETINFSTAQENTYKLINSDSWFETILTDDATKGYLQKNILERGKDVYFVVGYRTIKDSKVNHTDATGSHLSGNFEIPVSQLLAPGDISHISHQVNPAISASKKKEQEAQQTYKAVGEQVYAVEYRKISFEFFSKKKVDKAFLQHGSRWEIFWSSRGQEDDEDNIVEAKLVDASGLGTPIWQGEEDEEWVSLA
jgi:hypothetical protein